MDIDELLFQLEKQTKEEYYAIESSTNQCGTKHIGFACVREKGHSGLHIAIGEMQGLILVWLDILSDPNVIKIMQIAERLDKEKR